MTHRKVRSQGNVPFSWEQKPGVSKLFHNHYLSSPFSPPSSTAYRVEETPSSRTEEGASVVHGLNIPPPPPCRRRSHQHSAKGMRWGEGNDPFLAAYKECTKSVKNGKKKSKFGFSCKSNVSCEVRDDGFLNMSHLPKLRSDRIHVSSWK